jgi:NAD(P)-dependent dehydrogenase (short-subunit alcohol dehydrogenase family)
MASATSTTHEVASAESRSQHSTCRTSLSESDELANKVVFIVGGTGGIGRALADELIARRCHVVIGSRNVPEATIETGTTSCQRVTCDVRKADTIEAAFDNILERHGRIDIVVNCAGIGRSANSRNWVEPTISLGDDDWQEVCDTNLRGMFLIARAAAKRMIPRRSGQIVNISSARGAIRGLPFASAYCATKMATKAMFQSLADELSPLGIRVWSVLPDAVATGLIADTTLGKRGTIDAAQMGSLIADLLAFPKDAALHELLLAPFVSTSMAAGGIL